MELRDVMRTTPATRDFTDEAVDDATVHDLLDVARFAPSGGNRQGWHAILVKDPALRSGLRDLYVLGWREYMAHVKAGLVPFAPLADGNWTGPAVDLAEARDIPAPLGFADQLDKVPVLLVLTVELAALAVTDNGLGRQSIVGGASVYPFAHNLLLAARDRGLGGVMTTVICRQEPALRDLLHIPSDHAVAGLVAIGRPERVLTRLRRDPVDQFTTVDRFDGAGFEAPRSGPP
jgi:nitroreductase